MGQSLTVWAEAARLASSSAIDSNGARDEDFTTLIIGSELGTGERLLATAGPATGVATGFAAGIFGKLKIVGPKGGGNAFGLSGSVGAARQPVNWRSRNFFGHTFNRHGAGPKNTARLTGRAGGTGQPQGQWLDNQRAAEFLNDLRDIGEAATVRIPKGLGRVIRPDGTFVDAEWATVVISPNGFRTAFPIIP